MQLPFLTVYPANALIRHLLNCDDIEEAVDFLKQVPHDIPNQFGLADKHGNLVCAECFSNSICVHPCPEYPWNKTLASMVYELDEGKMHIAFGNACEMPYHTYQFDR